MDLVSPPLPVAGVAEPIPEKPADLRADVRKAPARGIQLPGDGPDGFEQALIVLLASPQLGFGAGLLFAEDLFGEGAGDRRAEAGQAVL